MPPDIINAATVTLSLVAHTNVGKTALARTFLRRDIGQVRDQPHVTDISEAHTIIQSGSEVLRLWDTPGFGDTARLLRRLRQAGSPIGWILTQVWDRFADRPLWCSQQALRNVQEEADIVLYLINAAEQPLAAGYVGMEMEILEWMKVPVIALLNQTGPPRPFAEEKSDEARWGELLRNYPVVKGILNLDAFARCWVQEDVLLEKIAPVLAAPKRPAFERLAAAWRAENARIFAQSMKSLATQLAAAWCDRQVIEKLTLSDRLRGLIFPPNRGEGGALTGQETGMAVLAERLDHNIRASLDELIRLHGLEGSAGPQILQRFQKDFASAQPVSEGISAVLGGFVTGALGGLVADLAAGGLTFGGGALVGGLLGAAGAGSLAKGYNVIRREATASVRWSADFCAGLFRSALLRYLAVAHYGRGRGQYAETEHPKFWQVEVGAILEKMRPRLQELWERARSDTDKITTPLQELVTEAAEELLRNFYHRPAG